jgi:hypothetical protein
MSDGELTMNDYGFILERARLDSTKKLPRSTAEVIRACKDNEMFRERSLEVHSWIG